MPRSRLTSLRDLAAELVPPAAVEGIARVARPRRYFHGPISTWPSGSLYGAGDSELALESVQAVPSTELGDLLELPGPTTRALVSVLWSLSRGSEETPLRVLDFGGGGGPLYHLCRQLLPPSIHLDWRVHDLPHIVASSTATDELSWGSELGGVPRPIHTVVTDACLQYIQNPFDALREIAALGARDIIINRLPCSDGEPFMVMQRLKRAGRQIEFPMHVFNRREFDDVLVELGLRVRASWVCGPRYRIRYGVKAVDTYGFVLGT